MDRRGFLAIVGAGAAAGLPTLGARRAHAAAPPAAATERFDAGDWESVRRQFDLLDRSLEAYRLFPIELTKLTRAALKETGLDAKSMDRCKNFFALGIVLWLYDRPLQPLLEWLMKKFHKTKEVMAANGAALRAGYNFGNTTELFRIHYRVAPAKLPKGLASLVSLRVAAINGCPF